MRKLTSDGTLIAEKKFTKDNLHNSIVIDARILKEVMRELTAMSDVVIKYDGQVIISQDDNEGHNITVVGCNQNGEIFAREEINNN